MANIAATEITIESTIKGMQILYSNTKKQVLSLIKTYLMNHGNVLFFNTNNFDDDGNRYLSICLTSEGILINYINKNGKTLTSELDEFKLSLIMNVPRFFNYTISKYTWLCESAEDDDYLETPIIGFDTFKSAYNNMSKAAFDYARSIIAMKNHDNGKNFDINIKIVDSNTIIVDNVFKYRIIKTE